VYKRKDNCIVKMKVKVKVKLFLHLSITPWRRIGGVEMLLHASLNWAVDWCEWSASRPDKEVPVPTV
jgi:hypothetical protein